MKKIENFLGWLRSFLKSNNEIFTLALGILAIIVAVSANHLSEQSLLISRKSLSLTEKQTDIASSEAQVYLYVTGLNRPQHLQLHNSPAAFAPRLRVVNGVVKGMVTSQTYCSHIGRKGENNPQDGHGVSINLPPGEDVEGAACEYSIVSDDYSDADYEYNRLIRGLVFYKDRMDRDYIYSWCRHTIRGSSKPFPPNPQVVSCADIGMRDSTDIITKVTTRSYAN